MAGATIAVVALVAGAVLGVHQLASRQTPDTLASPQASPISCQGASVPNGPASQALKAATAGFFDQDTWSPGGQRDLPPCDDPGRAGVQGSMFWQANGPLPGLISLRTAKYDPAPSRDDVVDGQRRGDASATVVDEREWSDGFVVVLQVGRNIRRAIAVTPDGRLAEVDDVMEIEKFALTVDELAQVAESAHEATSAA